jgi:hypothetical protein
MKKVYFIFPLLGVLIFSGFYLNFTKSYEANIAAQKLKADEEKKAKAQQEIRNRDIAIKAAIDAQEKNKKKREEKERIEEAKKTARQDAEDHRQHTYDDRNKLRDQVSRLKKDLEEVKAATAKIVEEKKHYADENAFLQTYVKQAESNVKYYYDLLDKIADAEKKAAEAAAAAAAAAKKG